MTRSSTRPLRKRSPILHRVDILKKIVTKETKLWAINQPQKPQSRPNTGSLKGLPSWLATTLFQNTMKKRMHRYWEERRSAADTRANATLRANNSSGMRKPQATHDSCTMENIIHVRRAIKCVGAQKLPILFALMSFSTYLEYDSEESLVDAHGGSWSALSTSKQVARRLFSRGSASGQTMLSAPGDGGADGERGAVSSGGLASTDGAVCPWQCVHVCGGDIISKNDNCRR